MSTLSDTLRSKLENTVIKAREQAEKGARAALEGLEVHLRATTRELTSDERELRKRLRAHGRQIGDVLEPKTAHQTISHLTWECAYQHWHRMLFARFLAENQVLIHPELKVVVTLEECADLAKEEGLPDAWSVAAQYASRMLPQIFRQDHPVLQLRLPVEVQRGLENLLAALPAEVFHARDSLGWVYQFWQTKRKDEINKSEVKIGADELPAVTQLFTEPYMVDFLLQNSLGAWWVGAGRKLPEGLELPYLRFLDDGSPAAGKFEGWPSRTAELKVLDPCCGSGHFLVAAFDLLTRCRMAEEGLTARDAGDAVLTDNLFGLELDERCTQIAAFAVALAAWTLAGAGGWRRLPPLNLACSGLVVGSDKATWTSLVHQDQHNLLFAMEILHDSFQKAPFLGSLFSMVRSKATNFVDWRELETALEASLKTESGAEVHEAAVVAHGLAKAVAVLVQQYHLVATNVPYLSIGKQSGILRGYVENNYSEGKGDLATAFLSRCLEFCLAGGTVSAVLPQNWLFLTSYSKFRAKLLQENRLRILAPLGAGAFRTISGEVVKAILMVMNSGSGYSGGLFATGFAEPIYGLDTSEAKTVIEKAHLLSSKELVWVEQAKQLKNPDCRISLADLTETALLESYSSSNKGITTNDDLSLVAYYWELPHHGAGWEFFLSTVETTRDWGGMERIVLYEGGKGRMRRLAAEQDRDRRRDMQGKSAWGKPGIAVSCTGSLPLSQYGGHKFDTNVATIVSKNPSHLPAIWCFCSSPQYNIEVRKIDQKLNVTNATLVKVPFDLEYWQKVAAERYPNGLPQPYSDDPTQWLFHGHSRPSTAPLQVAIARLLGYTWPAETDEKMELSDEARAWTARSQLLKAHVDQDGIVCLPSVRGEAPAAERVQAVLADAFGEEWSANLLEGLLKDVQCPGWSLERWLRDKFFEQHCAFFHHRPFIWHIWDGRKDGFSALVNYHSLDHKRLETLVYDYLGDWIRRQQDELNQSVDGARERLDAAVWLKGRLEAILEGEAPYDIFVRWKSLEKQPIGWEPDINDGVRLNIRPFVEAGVLRKEPKIKWDKDRGKDPAGSPWGEERLNDRHLKLEEKRLARRMGK